VEESAVRLLEQEEKDRPHVQVDALDQKCAISSSEFQNFVDMVRIELVR
jgi:hypothetical protein